MKHLGLLLVELEERGLLRCLLLLLLAALLFGEALEQVGEDVVKSRATAGADDGVEGTETVRNGGENVEEHLAVESRYERHVIGGEDFQESVVALTKLGVHLEGEDNKWSGSTITCPFQATKLGTYHQV